MPSRTSTQRSGRGRPVITRSPATRRCRPVNRPGSSPPGCSLALARSPETSSRTPRCWPIAPPHGSASRTSGSRPRRASSPAMPRATVVRPGAPPGPQTATTRPAPRAASGPERAGSGSSSAGAAAARTASGSRSSRRASTVPVRPRRASTAVTSVVASGWTTATGRTPCRRRWSTAAGSRPGASSETTATDACPVAAVAIRSVTSMQRLSTTIVGRAVSSRRAVDSHGAPAATTRTPVRWLSTLNPAG